MHCLQCPSCSSQYRSTTRHKNNAYEACTGSNVTQDLHGICVHVAASWGTLVSARTCTRADRTRFCQSDTATATTLAMSEVHGKRLSVILIIDHNQGSFLPIPTSRGPYCPGVVPRPQLPPLTCCLHAGWCSPRRIRTLRESRMCNLA